MMAMCVQEEYKQLAVEIDILCREYHFLALQVETRQELVGIKVKLEKIWHGLRGKLGIDMPVLLLALMDAYEVTRNERMLQEVLDVVSRNIENLEISEEGVRLMAYCYYYVEEEECAVRAKTMLKQLESLGTNSKKVAELERIVEELTENN